MPTGVPSDVVDSIATLKNTEQPPASGSKEVLVEGYATPADGGGGIFIWVANSTSADDGGTIIQSTVSGAPPGRWQRMHDGRLNVKWFGAKGDGSTNDAAAINAAESARASYIGNGGLDPGFGGALLHFPTGTYCVSSEIQITKSQNAYWTGVGKHGISVIKAIASMRAVVSNASQRSYLADLTIYANNLADYGLLRLGDGESVYARLWVEGARLDAICSSAIKTGRTVTSVVPPQNAPTITVTASSVEIGTHQPTSVLLKITTSGVNDGSAQYAYSGDGGATYSLPQGVYPTSNAAETGTGGAGTSGKWSGLTITFPAGTYTAGQVYTVNLTTVTAANNDGTSLYDCTGQSSGVTYYSAGAHHSGSTVQTQVAGTITSAAGSNILVGAGTSFTSTRARCGDMIYVYGTNAWYEVLCVLDDTHILVGNSAKSTIASHAGVDFNIGVGWGFRDAWNFDANIEHIVAGHFGGGSPGGLCLLGTIGETLVGVEADQCGAVGITIGTDDGSFTYGSLVERPYFEPGDNVIGLGFYNAAGSSVTMLEPANWTRQGPGTELLVVSSTVYGTARVMATTEQLLPTSITLSADRTTLNAPAPATQGQGGDGLTPVTSLLSITPTADGFSIIGFNQQQVPLASGGGEGTRVRLLNTSDSHSFALVDLYYSGVNLLLEAPKILVTPHSYVDFINHLGAWHQTTKVVANRLSNSSLPYQPGGEGGSLVVTTNATQTMLYPLPYDSTVLAVTGCRADVSAYLADGSQGAVWEGIFAVFKNGGTQLGTTAIAHAVGTNGGNPPAGWSVAVVPTGTISGINYPCVAVTGVAATTITWRCKIRLF
jgi:hypothetical protein